MKEQAKRFWGWMRRHRIESVFMLIVLLAAMGVGVFWTVNLARFGLPPPTGQNCGSILHVSFSPKKTDRADASLQHLTCFWQAYQTCRAATMSQTLAGTDVGHTDTLTIERRNNRCAIYGHEEYWVNTSRGTVTFLCTQLSKEGDNLRVSACDGAESFDLLSRTVIFESYGCGTVNFTSSYAYRIPDMQACFFTAYQQCLADSIAYRTAANGVQTERDFYIDNYCGIGYSRGIVDEQRGIVPRKPGAKLAACSGLEMRADGLHFSQCGTDGDIFIPNNPPTSS